MSIVVFTMVFTVVSIVMIIVVWVLSVVSVVKQSKHNAILEVTAEKPLLGKRSRVLNRVDSPSIVAPEKHWLLLFNGDTLFKVVLEKLAGLSTDVLYHLLNF